jgi:hypothetical protein
MKLLPFHPTRASLELLCGNARPPEKHDDVWQRATNKVNCLSRLRIGET